MSLCENIAQHSSLTLIQYLRTGRWCCCRPSNRCCHACCRPTQAKTAQSAEACEQTDRSIRVSHEKTETPAWNFERVCLQEICCMRSTWAETGGTHVLETDGMRFQLWQIGTYRKRKDKHQDTADVNNHKKDWYKACVVHCCQTWDLISPSWTSQDRQERWFSACCFEKGSMATAVSTLTN